MILNYDHNCRFIVLATINRIVNYDPKTFMVQAIDLYWDLYNHERRHNIDFEF
jgi:hypothetical protein